MRKFLTTGLALALVISGGVILSHVPQGLTEPIDLEMGRVANLNQAETTVPATRYVVSGDRQGQVTVKNTISGKVIRTFQMDRDVVVRETFLLDSGRTVAASQKDRAVFWDLATGREIRRFPQRIYGFSHDETRFFTFQYPEGILLYAYPNLTFICRLTKQDGNDGPWDFRFSPNDKFLVVLFGTGKPERDEAYPHGENTYRAVFYRKLFNLQTCQEIEEFSKTFRSGFNIGEFSADSRFLDMKDEYLPTEHGYLRGLWRFDLTTYKAEIISE